MFVRIRTADSCALTVSWPVCVTRLESLPMQSSRVIVLVCSASLSLDALPDPRCLSERALCDDPWLAIGPRHPNLSFHIHSGGFTTKFE